ncbi:MAG: 50S ribosomal protein L6 [Deltaproteobacteria bacterium]|nr:50S ribosomal protein L6 [Deltaproteobacteria bacterium]
MSRIGRKPLEIPKGVQVQITAEAVAVKGPKGSLKLPRHKAIEIKEDKGQLVFTRSGEQGPERAAHGLMRALCANMFTGVTNGFERKLEINGVGYKAEVKGTMLVLSLGFSHPVEYKLPEGVTAKVDKNMLILASIDRELLGAAASKIRSFRPPEPYKGKGIKYVEETILRKAGKTAGK